MCFICHPRVFPFTQCGPGKTKGWKLRASDGELFGAFDNEQLAGHPCHRFATTVTSSQLVE